MEPELALKVLELALKALELALALNHHRADPEKSFACNSNHSPQSHHHWHVPALQWAAKDKTNLKSTHSQFANSRIHIFHQVLVEVLVLVEMGVAQVLALDCTCLALDLASLYQ